VTEKPEPKYLTNFRELAEEWGSLQNSGDPNAEKYLERTAKKARTAYKNLSKRGRELVDAEDFSLVRYQNS
jgi:hypothetical protein